MRLEIDVTLDYKIKDERVLLLLEAADMADQVVISSAMEIEGASLSRIAGEGGIGNWLWAQIEGGEMRLRYRSSVEISRVEPALQTLGATEIFELPAEALTYLRPSRYCQSDLLEAFAQEEFGAFEGGAKIAAIRDWVAREMRYVRGASHSGTTALDTFESREGVCRDFAHLLCALARAAHIPARYAAVYGADVSPPDFHAVAQVWLEGGWHFVDATGMCKASALAVIGVGRDACEVAFMETEQDAQMLRQIVRVCAV